MRIHAEKGAGDIFHRRYRAVRESMALILLDVGWGRSRSAAQIGERQPYDHDREGDDDEGDHKPLHFHAGAGPAHQ